MDITTSTWTELLQQFLPIFTAPGAEVFSQLMTGWILCTVRRTVTGILPFADPWAKHAHDAYHRFFPATTHWEYTHNPLLPDAELPLGEVWMVVGRATGKVFTAEVVGVGHGFQMKSYYPGVTVFSIHALPSRLI